MCLTSIFGIQTIPSRAVGRHWRLLSRDGRAVPGRRAEAVAGGAFHWDPYWEYMKL